MRFKGVTQDFFTLGVWAHNALTLSLAISLTSFEVLVTLHTSSLIGPQCLNIDLAQPR
jgi:hypothetical protein